MNRAALLALADQAARDPSRARRLLELADAMVAGEIKQGEGTMPAGYIYAGAHHFVATFEEVEPEPLPSDTGPTLELTATANAPQTIRIPFDCLIMGASGWAAPEVPRELTTAEKNGLLMIGGDPSGRDLFSVAWAVEGERFFATDGRNSLLEPAPALLGTREHPRQMAWKLQRGTILQVYVKNLTNVAVPFTFYEQQDAAGWPIAVAVTFHALNLELP